MNENKKPHDFVYITDIEPTIQESLKLATQFNFTDSVIPGYSKHARAL
jgi:D-alanyl-D-alanine dipeptidase